MLFLFFPFSPFFLLITFLCVFYILHLLDTIRLGSTLVLISSLSSWASPQRHGKHRAPLQLVSLVTTPWSHVAITPGTHLTYADSNRFSFRCHEYTFIIDINLTS